MPAALPIIGNIAIQLAVGVGLSFISGLIAPQKTTPEKAVQGGFATSMSVGESHPVSAVFGRGVASGNLIYVNSYGANNEYCQLVIDVGYGWHEGLDIFLLDGKAAALAGSNGDARGRSVVAYTAGGTPYMWVKAYTGAPGQTADPELVARANPAGRWGNFHKATGHAYLIITLRDNADLYPSKFPSFGSVWKGLRLYDWRKDSTVAGGSGAQRWGVPSTYAWSDNPYVIRWNWRRGIYVGNVRVLGLGYPFYAQHLGYYTAAANVADELVHDPVTDLTFARYAYGREISDAEDKMAVLAEIDAACCGTSCKIGGADAPLPAVQQIPVLTLNDRDRVAGTPIIADRKGLVSVKKTAWAGRYVSPASNWQATPYQTRINAELKILLGGSRTQPMDQPYETLEPRAQMRAEIAARRQSYAGTRTETFNPKARQLDVGDCITRACEWGNMLMIVTRKARTDDRLGVTLDLAEWDNSIVPASGDSFVTEPAEPGLAPARPDRMIMVQGAVAAPYAEQGGGATHAALRFTINEITDQSVDNWFVRYWPSAGSEAADGKTLAGTRYNRSLVTPALAPETEYAWSIGIACTPWRATVATPLALVTTGIESIPLGDDSVELAQLTEVAREAILYAGPSSRAMIDAIDRLAADGAAQDFAGLADYQTASRQLTSTTGDLMASFDERLLVATGPGSAITEAITALQVALGGDATGVNIRFSAGYTPDAGFESKIGLEAYSEVAGAFRAAGIFVQVNAAGGSVTLVGSKVGITDDLGRTYALFDAEGQIVNGTIRGPGGRSFWNLETGAFRVST